ncbi:shikimate dehydrogenase [Cutibacterium sp. WCA-380-WT-3A]|uniref:Shikimate dehydrogenase n=1 Tax=Cutibacterium porci TaxID=2605781 RepID=A0A7K0J6C1_9ACTN|nr:shikimate dehydrogenase [Cutibacterium porci]MSS45479.1 shikimate dehydrogenase [Cutibacterium porci]
MHCAVIGHPIAHSLSPAIHRAAYQFLNLDWTYQAIDIASGGLGAFIDGIDDSWRGLSVTMPHKVDVVGLGQTDSTVDLLGAANTWVRCGKNAIVRNTDVTGAGIALRANGVTDVGTVVMLGAGATARSVLAATIDLGARELVVMSRSRQRSTEILELAHRLGLHVSWQPFGADPPQCDLVVSTVPASSLLTRAGDLAARTKAVFDVIYDPWPTPLTVAGEAAGITVIDGLDLLAGQAVDQVRLMTGRQVPMRLLRSTAQNALTERTHL